jgi:hypothetical protein
MLSVGLLFLLAVCDITPDVRSGRKKVTIRFAASTSNEEGDEEVLRSAGVREAETQTQTILLGNGLFLYATLKPDSTGATNELRAAIPPTEGQKVCLWVVEAYSMALVFTAMYTYIGGQMVTDEDNPLEVEPGGYEFAAYSYYNSTETPETTDIDPVKDLVLGYQYDKEITDDDRTVSIHMTHQFSKVRVRVKTEIAGAAITDIDDVSIVSGYANLLVGNGGVRIHRGADITLPVTFPDFELTTEITGNETYMVYPEMRVNIGSITVEVLGIAGTVNPVTMNNLSLKYNLTGGKRYVLEMNVRQTRWAFSNIYWQAVDDEDDAQYPGYMTFDTQNKGHQGDQGAYSQWNSLMGLVPVNGSTTNYAPTYVASDRYHSTWGTISYGEYWWTGDAEYGYYDYDNTYLADPKRNTPEMYANRKGDICQYLGKTDSTLYGYRMPIANEFPAMGWVVEEGNKAILHR